MKFFIFIFAVFLTVMFGRSVDAQVSLAPTTAPFNSFEAFWPLVAGRTIDDPLYFLKDLKEKARGWLIFGAAQKADYNTLTCGRPDRRNTNKTRAGYRNS